jgi:Alpha-L-arabinofuranosidase
MAPGWNAIASPSVDLQSASPVFSGNTAIRVTPDGIDGLEVERTTSINPHPYRSLAFRAHGGSTGGQQLVISGDRNGMLAGSLALAPLASNMWQQVSVPLAQLEVAGASGFSGFSIFSSSTEPVAAFSLDDIRLDLAQTADVVIYDDATLKNGFGTRGSRAPNFGNLATVLNLNATTVKRSGTSSISFRVLGNGNNASSLFSFILDGFAAVGVRVPPFKALSFWIYSPVDVPAGQIRLNARTYTNPPTPDPNVLPPTLTLPALPAGQWVKLTYPLADFGFTAATTYPLAGFMITGSSPSTDYTIHLDDIAIEAIDPPAVAHATVDFSRPVRTVRSDLFGLNLIANAWQIQFGADARFTDTVNKLRDAGITGPIRFPGGNLSNAYFWLDHTYLGNPLNQTHLPFRRAAQLAEALGVNMSICANYGTGTAEMAAAWVAYVNGYPADSRPIGVDINGEDWGTVGQWAALRGATPIAVDDGLNHLRAGHPEPYRFTYWEVGNENFGNHSADSHGQSVPYAPTLPGRPWDPITYAEQFVQFYTKMKMVDPTIRVGAVVMDREWDGPSRYNDTVVNPVTGQTVNGWTPILLTRLREAGVLPDDVIIHRYPQGQNRESDGLVLHVTDELPDGIAETRLMLEQYLAEAADGIRITVTETNITTVSSKQSVNLVNALFLVDQVLRLAETEIDALVWWSLHSASLRTGSGNNNSPLLYGWREVGDASILASNAFPGHALNQPYPTYYGYQLLSEFAAGGDTLVTASEDYPWIELYGSNRANGQQALLLLNKHATADQVVRVTLPGYVPAGSSAVHLSYGKENDLANIGLSTGTFNGLASTFEITVPAYSMHVLQFTGAIAPTITGSPQSQTVSAGSVVSLSVTAEGTAPFSYQWFRNGVAIDGATDRVLLIDDTSVAHTGTYIVTVTNAAGSATSEAATLVVQPLSATIEGLGETRSYDGSPQIATITTDPAGLPLSVLYNESPAAPVLPGTYFVTASSADPDYTGIGEGELTIRPTALVRHAPTLNGHIAGSVQIALPESITLNSQAAVMLDLLVPGTPTIRLNGSPDYAGSWDASGNAAPTMHALTLNSGAQLRHVVRRVDAPAWSVVHAPPSPAGNRNVVINQNGGGIGDSTTLRDLTLNHGAPEIAVPPGTYGRFTLNSGTTLVLGVPGSVTPVTYNLQALTLNHGARLRVLGPVVLTLAQGASLQGAIGDVAHPGRLVLRVASGNVTLNSGAQLAGEVLVPGGTLILNGNAQLLGRSVSSRLTVNSGATLTDPDL